MEERDCSEFAFRLRIMLKDLWRSNYVLNALISADSECSMEYFYVYRPFNKTGMKRWGVIEFYQIDSLIESNSLTLNSVENMNGMTMKVRF